MKTFKQFLYESRVSTVDVTKLMTWVDDNAAEYMSGRHFLYRGGSGASGNGEGKGFFFGDSSKGEPRKSANTNNNYTLWFDNSPAFKGWPKRSRSFIATSDYAGAEGFGNVHLIVPADNNKIGEVGAEDLWQIEILPSVTIEDWNYNMEKMLRLVGRGGNKTYEELRNALNFATPDNIKAGTAVGTAVGTTAFEREEVSTMLDQMKKAKCNTLLQMWEKYFTPHLFNQTTGSQVSRRSADGEVWIEGPCAFIPMDTPKNDGDAEQILDWTRHTYPGVYRVLNNIWDIRAKKDNEKEDHDHEHDEDDYERDGAD